MSWSLGVTDKEIETGQLAGHLAVSGSSHHSLVQHAEEQEGDYECSFDARVDCDPVDVSKCCSFPASALSSFYGELCASVSCWTAPYEEGQAGS